MQDGINTFRSLSPSVGLLPLGVLKVGEPLEIGFADGVLQRGMACGHRAAHDLQALRFVLLLAPTRQVRSECKRNLA